MAIALSSAIPAWVFARALRRTAARARRSWTAAVSASRFTYLTGVRTIAFSEPSERSPLVYPSARAASKPSPPFQKE